MMRSKTRKINHFHSPRVFSATSCVFSQEEFGQVHGTPVDGSGGQHSMDPRTLVLGRGLPDSQTTNLEVI